jgi:hypothetical protein
MFLLHPFQFIICCYLTIRRCLVWAIATEIKPYTNSNHTENMIWNYVYVTYLFSETSRSTLQPTQRHIQGAPVFFAWLKATGTPRWPVTSKRRGYEWVELHLYFSYTPSSRGQGQFEPFTLGMAMCCKFVPWYFVETDKRITFQIYRILCCVQAEGDPAIRVEALSIFRSFSLLTFHSSFPSSSVSSS